jgi:hypothetical protein
MNGASGTDDAERIELDLLDLFAWGMKRRQPRLIQPLDASGPILNLGSGFTTIQWHEWFSKRVVNLDLPGWDANSLDPFANVPDESVDGIFAFHFFEHIDHVVRMLWECQRILRVGAPLTIVVPYGASTIAIQDLTHQHFFNEETWKTLFSNQYYDPGQLTGTAKWHYRIGTNVIMGIVERNLALVTQLVKTT